MKSKFFESTKILKTMVSTLLAAIIILSTLAPFASASTATPANSAVSAVSAVSANQSASTTTTRPGYRPRYQIPTNFTELVEEIRGIIFTYNPEIADMLLEVTDQTRPNLPVSGPQSPNFHPGLHTHTINEFIAVYVIDGPNMAAQMWDGTIRAIHYAAHWYVMLLTPSRLVGGQWWRSFDFKVSGQRITVAFSAGHDSLIPTAASAGSLPQQFRCSLWEKYVSPTSYNMCANVNAVYGLLNELFAFYTDARGMAGGMNGYIMSYIERNGFCVDIARIFFFNRGHVSLFYSFVFWTVHHLLYLQENHPVQFRNIMNNEAFRKVFAYTYHNYRELIYVITQNNNREFLESLSMMGVRFTAENGVAWFDVGNGWQSGVNIAPHSTRCEKAAIVIQELSTPRYADMLSYLLGDFSIE